MSRQRELLVATVAHCDTGDDYLGSRFHHGASFRRAVEEPLIDPKRAIQIGIRGSLNEANMWQFSHDRGMRVVSIEEFHDKAWRWAARPNAEIRSRRSDFRAHERSSMLGYNEVIDR